MCQVQELPKIIMVFNNNHFEFLPIFLQWCALYFEAAVRKLSQL